MAGRLARSVRAADVPGRVKHATKTLRDEYEAGKRGEEAPAQPIWASPKEQLDAILGLLRSAGDTADPVDVDETAGVREAAAATDATDPLNPISDEAIAADADEIAAALRNVDWTSVKAAAAERTGDAARTVKAMADQVDWARVQPVAAQVSSALIAAVASGQLGVGGRLGSTVARAIVDQGGLGQQVAARVNAKQLSVPADLRRIIDATARDT